jgi:hypothetical protein
MAWARHGKCESDTAALCKTNVKDSKPLAARHGRGTAWARHAMCELAFNVSVTDHVSQTTELSEVICVLKLVNVHTQLGIKKPKHMNSDLLFTIKTNSNSNNSYSFYVITSLKNDF